MKKLQKLLMATAFPIPVILYVIDNRPLLSLEYNCNYIDFVDKLINDTN